MRNSNLIEHYSEKEDLRYKQFLLQLRQSKLDPSFEFHAAVIFAESLEVLLIALESLHEEAKPLGLEVSWLKTKVQLVSVRDNLAWRRPRVHKARGWGKLMFLVESCLVWEVSLHGDSGVVSPRSGVVGWARRCAPGVCPQ
ncbi:hypothetical protein GWK47_008003 [Chionoecetes opilio]|uniref:Uncharacterized protein n=1 Tax=Chionoecetes opilio TaxID=41210 RepID=A0A8J4Y0H4_CHIOP|nr:hypothetical protein GWK47_008003 [Chionoecetes opilio]